MTNDMEYTNNNESNKEDRFLPLAIVLAAAMIAGAWIYTSGPKISRTPKQTGSVAESALSSDFENKVLPSSGAVLPVRWGDLGIKLVGTGVIDRSKLEELYAARGGLDREVKTLLENVYDDQMVMTADNAGFLLNLFWALGLGTKNDILEKGPMADSQYGGAENFASTGGWTLARGDAMDHYSRHPFIVLTPEEQQLVERVSKNIYRPCCNNSTYFPDCNHGMAMLGLLELMASQGVSEEKMYKVALQVNSYWFPDTYLTIAKFLESKGTSWEKANPKEILGYQYSSFSGYQRILSRITAPERKSGGSCGV